MTSVVIVPEVADSQMGVSFTLEGTRDWNTYLEVQVEDNFIDQETADNWNRWYDGYKMKWTFSNPAMTASAEGAIDAACIRS